MGRQYPCLLLLSGSGPERLQCPPATDLSAELAATLTAKSGYNDSGAAELAAALIGKRNAKLICTRVTGAAGVAINCCSYARGTRVLQNDQVAQKRVIAKIENTRGPVDDEWEKWVRQQIPPFIQKGATRLPSGVSQLSANALSTAACKASELSKSFYETLETSCQNDLIPSGKDLSTKWVLL